MLHRHLPAVLLPVVVTAAAAQEPTPQSPPVLVTASRTAQDPFDAPWAAQVIDQQTLRRNAYRSTPQALRDVPSVHLQETAPGQGSPYLRGFTGYHNLFLIDGVRLNNSVFRSGPNQYWSTVDPLSIERLEVVMGPSSALYGSDAIGGTVQAFTRSPWRYAEGPGFAYGGSAYGRYASGEDGIAGRLELSLGQTWADGSRTGMLLGGDAKAFGEFEGGHATGAQFDTGYDENAVDAKIEHRLDEHTRLVFLHQRLRQSDVPRTHATQSGISYAGTAVGTDRSRDLDQGRHLTYLQLHREGLEGPIQAMRWNLSWHQQDESQDRVRSNGAAEFQGFDVGTLGAWVQLESATSFGDLTYGIDYYRDHVDSFFRRSSNPVPADLIQGPVADDATYDLLGVYVQDAVTLGEGWHLTLGGRYTYAAVDADSVRDPATSTRIGIADHWDEFTGSARLLHELLPRRWNAYVGVSQGFRAPNLSDLSSFETARSGEQEIPAPGLEPEQYLGYEVGTRYRHGDVTAAMAWYYTDIEDQMLRFPTGTTAGNGQPIVTRANVGDGYVEGAEASASWRCWRDLSLFGAFAWQYGQVRNFDSGGATSRNEFITRMMPTMTRVGVRWDDREGRFYAESEVVRAEDQDKLSAGDVRDTQRVPPGGTPGWTLWHLRAGFEVSASASLFAALENVTDVDYRVHGSGSNGIGRSLILGYAVTF